jgi:Tfp pilus assembly protein PilN
MLIGLNLATKPLVSHRRFLVGSALLGFVASVLFVYLGWHFYTLRKADEEFRASVAKLQSEMERQQQQRAELERFFAREENRNLQARAKFVGNVIEARSFNWTKMFMDLERTLPPGVHVLKIEPTLENGSASVKFLVGGSSQESKVKLLQAFEDSKSFSNVELTGEAVPKQAEKSTDVFLVQFSAVYTGV